jgi:RHS repeat-associated protein
VYRGAAVLATIDAENQTRRFHLDHLGSARVITGDDGRAIARHTYYPFGVEIDPPAQDAEKLRFTGHERDASLDYMHARYYTDMTGRFLSVDPALDLKKTLPSPQIWNRYSYVVNNPARYVDPDGREHTNEPPFTRSLTEANDWNKYPSVSWAFNIQGILLSFTADEFLIGPAIGRVATGIAGLFRSPAVLLGENMGRVTAGAKMLGAKLFGEPGATAAETMVRNMSWLEKQIKNGTKILDIGLDAARGGRAGVFYKAEVAYLEAARYTRQFVKLIQIEGKTYRLYQWVPK